MTHYYYATAPYFVIGLPLNFLGLPKTIEVNGSTLVLKDEFHVSLVCTGKIIEKFNIIDHDFSEKVNEDFKNFVIEKEVKLQKFRDEFRFVEKGDKKTVVCMCNIENLNEFFDLINRKYNLAITYPPTHVTMYTLQPNAGIFLTNDDDIKHLTKPIVNPLHKDLNTFVSL